MRRKKQKPGLLLEELEPRILHSADVAALVPSPAIAQLVEMRVVETAPVPVADTAAAAQTTQSQREIVIVDSAVQDYQSLIDDLQRSRDADLAVYVLDARADGVAQVSDILAGEHDVQAVHLISHGGEGGVRLGAGVLDRDTLARDADAISGWARALTADADFLIYGCDVAAGPDGRAFVDALAAMTGADVAASTDLTGSPVKGGDWTLEYAAGRIDEAALAPAAAGAWNGILAGNEAPVVTDHALSFDGTDVVVVPGSPSLTMGSTMTLEATIQRTGPLGPPGPDHQMILNKEGEYELGISATGNLEWAFANATPGWNWVDTGYTVPADTWVHIAVTYNDGVVNTYVDGTLVDTNSGTGPVGDSHPAENDFTVGSRQDGAELKFVGLIDEIRVWNIERSAAEVLSSYRTPLTGAETGLVAYWRFDEASGTTAIDASGHNNNGVLGNRVAADVPARTTNLDYAVTEDTPLAVAAPGVLQFATDAEGLPVTAALVSGPAHAAAFTLNADGSFDYTPTADYNGADAFTFKASDGTVDSDPVTVRLAVAAVNDPPARSAGAVNDLTVLEDATATSLGLGTLAYSTGGGVDEAAQTLTYTVTAVPAAALGAVTLADGTTAVTTSTSYTLVQLQGMEFKAAPGASGGPATFSWSVVDSAGGADTLLESLTISVTSVNDAPSGTDKTVITPEDTAYTFAAADFGFSDSGDTPGNSLLAVKIGALPGAGSLTLSGGGVSAGQSIAATDITAGNLKFTPAANANGAAHASFTFQVQDDGGVVNGGVDLDPTLRTMTIDVTAVNDAPVLVGTNDLGGINRNPTSNPGTLVADLLASHVTDADSADLAGIAVTAVDNTNGAWEYSTNGGSTWTAFGSPTTGTARLLAADVSTYVRFVPNTNFSGSVANGLTFKAWDQTSGAAGAIADATVGGAATAFSTASASASITVTATNTAPTLTGSNNLAAINEDATGNAGTLVSSLIASMTSDVDPGALTGIAVTGVDNTNGAWQYSLNGGSSWTGFSGPTATNARLLAADANTFVRFVPNADFNGTVSNGITFRAWDRSTGVNGGTADTSGLAGTFRDDFQTASYSNNNGTLAWSGPWVETDSSGGGAASGRFQITSGLLSIQSATPGDNIYREANLSGATGATLTFTYASGLKNTAELHIQVSSDGGATYTTLPGGVFDTNTIRLGSRTIDISSSIASNTRIRWLVVNGEGAPDKNAFLIGDMQITASGHNGGSTAFSTATASASVAVNAVNDAPVRTAGAVNNLTVLEDAPATSLGLGTLAYGAGGGADEAVQALTYTITGVPAAALGTVTLADGTTAVTASTTYTLTQLQGMQFKAAPNANGGPATFSWTVADSGGTANGGVDTLNQSLTISVTSVNDAPAGTNRTVTMFEDTTYTIPLTDFGYTDGSDTPSNQLLNVHIGTVPVAGALTLSGVAVSAGQTISGASIAAGNLKFAPAANANGGGYASFTFRVQDDGGLANGAADTDSVARTFTIDVTPVSDAPVGTNKTVTTLEDTTYTFAVADFGFSDAADGNALLGVKIAALPAAGSLTLAGSAVAANQTVSAAAITAGSLKFTPAANANGAAYATFTFQVQDNGGTANGGADLDATARTITVAVTPINDAPSGTSRTVSTLEDTAYTFTAADFGFSDALDGNALANVKIASLPVTGTLTLSGVALVAGQSVSAASIGAGTLKFTPLAQANGTGYASFTFQVQDDGGVASGGVDLDPIARTMTVDVTAVNDAPTLTSGAVITLAATNEDSPSTATSVSAILAGAALGDVDAGAASGIAITAAAGNGVWQYSTDGVAWQRFGTVSSTSALLLSSAMQVRYLPDGVNGETATFAFRAWDRTTGAASTNAVQAYANPGVGGGATAYSAATASASLAVAGINDAPAVADRALAFDGTDQIVVPGNPSLVMTSTLTLEADIQRTGPLGPARQMILNKEGEYELAISPNGKLSWAFANATPGWNWIETGLTIPADTWVHIAVTYDNGLVKMYANGTLVDTIQGSGTIGDIIPLRNDFTIAGRQDNTEQRFVGLIDEVRVWNVARSGAEIAATSQTTLTGSEAGLVAYWRFDETSGAAAIDSSGHGNGGTLGNGVAADVPSRTTNLDYAVVEDNTLAVGGAGVLARATDPEGAALSANLVSGPAHASAFTLNADGSFSYTPTADFNGSDSFVFAASDGALTSRPVTVRFTVSAANDAPTLANGTLAATLEDAGAPSGAAVSAIFAGAFADVDAGAAFTGVAVAGNGASASAQGVWQYSSDAGATWFAVGSVGDGPAALALSASTLLRFAPAADFNGVPDALTVRGLDDTYLGAFSDTVGVETRVTIDTSVAGGTTAITAATATVSTSVAAANDAPAGADHTVVALEDTAYTFSVADFGFSDPRDGNSLSSVRIATLPAGGALMLSGVAVAPGQAVSAAGIAAGNLRFSPAADANGAGAATFTFQVQDDGGTANGGVDLDPIARTMTVDVTAVNDAPAGASNIVTTLEDTPYVFTTADFGFADAVEGNALLAVKIAALPTAGGLMLNGVAVAANQVVSAASISAGALRFAPAADASGAGYASFTFQVQDDGGIANGGVDLDPTPRTMSVDVIAVSDAPAGASNTVTTLEDTPYTSTAADFGFVDTADSNALSNVKIAALPGAGSLTLGGVAVTADQLVSAASIAAGDLRFTPAPDANGAAYASFAFQVQDDGGTSNGGADLDPTPRTMTIAVTPVNDAPAGADRTVTTLEDTPYTFTAADFGFSDAADGPDALLAVRIGAAPATGTLAYDFVPIAPGQVITAADIAAGKLMFVPALDGNASPYASFTFQVQDDGGTANVGIDLDPIARTMTVAVTPVNDAPSGASSTVTTPEDTPYAFTAADFGFSDASDSNALRDVKIASLPAAGTLTLAGAAVTANQFVSAASIAAGDLRFTPAADANGAAYASFTFQVRDDGGTADGGSDLDPIARTMTVAVTPVNDAPAGADRTVATLEDSAYRFGLADFGFSDARDANGLAAVKIVGVPASGSLMLAGVAVTAGQTVSAASIAAGDLLFAPAANDHGAAYASFGFQVQDDGGTVSGGVDTDPVTRTMTMDVASVNDAPNGADMTVTTGEGAEYTFGAADFGFSDSADRPANGLLAVKIAAVSGAGTLTLGGAQVTAGQVIAASRISAGELRFAPGANGSGTGYAAVTFQVQDDGGTAAGGADTDSTVRTVTVDVLRRPLVPVPDASLAVTDVPPASPPPPARVTQAEEAAAESSSADSRAKATLARIAAELSGAIARTQSAPTADTSAEVLAPPPTPDLRNDAAASGAPTSSSAARRDAGAAGAVVVPVLFEMRPDALAPAPIALSLSTASRAAAATTPDADPRSQQDDAKHQAYALLTMENGVRASAIIVSAGMVTWTLHGAGLIASLLTSAPAWRHLDPLPVLAPETEKPDWGEDDGDSQREEDAADRLWLGSSQRPPRPL